MTVVLLKFSFKAACVRQHSEMVHFSCISATKEAVDAIEIEVDVNSEISPREMLTMNAPNKLERDMQGLIMFTVEI